MTRSGREQFRLTLCRSSDGSCFSLTQEPSGFHEPLVRLYRQMSSRRFDPGSKTWQFSACDEKDLLKLISSHCPEVEVVKRMSTSDANCNISKPTCMFVLCDLRRFHVISSYDKKQNDVFKTMPTRAYNASQRTWSFDLSDHDNLVRSLREADVPFRLIPMPGWILKFLDSHKRHLADQDGAARDYDRICRQRVPEALLARLLPFQRDALRYALMNDGRLLLADDMGLGKTLQSLTMALLYRQEWPLLVISPASVKYGWQEQILKWLPDIVVDEIHVVDKQQESISNSHPITIVSYDCLARQTLRNRLLSFKVVIADESHQLKNVRTARCKHVIPILKQAKRLFLLSGTPALSRPLELYPQLNCLYPTVFRNLNDFGKRYCGGKLTKWGWDYSGCTHISELQTILDCGLMIRRDKEAVLEELPNKLRQIVILDDGVVQTDKRRGLVEASKRALNAKAKEKHACLLNYFHETAMVKADGVRKYLMENVDLSSKHIVFAHHQVMMDRMCDLCETMAVQYIRIDGSISAHRRQVLVEKFQFEDDIKIAVLAILTAGTGVNLTAAKTVIFAELFWNPGILLQAEDRAYRLGREVDLRIIYLLAKNTSDDLIWPLVQRKLRILANVGLSKQDALSTDDIGQQDGEMEASCLDRLGRCAGSRRIDEYMLADKRSDDEKVRECDRLNECDESHYMNDDELIEAAIDMEEEK